MLFDLNYFEWFILGVVFVLIAALMNMFPLCRWIAERILGKKSSAQESPE